MWNRADGRGTIRIVSLVSLLALGGQGCDDDISGPQRFEAEQPFAFAVQVTTQRAWILTGLNGRVEVVGVPGADSIRVEGVKRVLATDPEDAQQRLDDIEVVITEGADSIAIRSVHPRSSDARSYVVDYQLTVPGDLPAVMANGNGDITLESLGADVEISLGNGSALMDDIVGSAFVEVGNGDVECRATLPTEGVIAIAVGNGDIDLAVPVNTSAQLSATVGNGTIGVIGLTLQDLTETENALSGRLGTGSGSIDLATASGSIEIRGF